MAWTGWIHETRSGNLVQPVELVSSNWTRLLTGDGTGTFGFLLDQSGVPASLARELHVGAKYSFAVGWDNSDSCFHSGVILNRRIRETTGMCTVRTVELPRALFGARSHFGVNQYQPAGAGLTIAGRSFAGAVRAIIQACTAPSAEWALPIDLPTDGTGTFSLTSSMENALTMQAMIDMVRDEGAEVDFQPYFTSQQVRHSARVASRITTGSAFDLTVNGPGYVLNFEDEGDSSDSVTGILAFGDGEGQDRPYSYGPASGSGATDRPVRDRFDYFSDVKKQGSTIYQGAGTPLQRTATATYNRDSQALETTTFDLFVGDVGPSIAEPGRLLNLWSYGGYALADGVKNVRSTGLSGDLSLIVTPQVEAL